MCSMRHRDRDGGNRSIDEAVTKNQEGSMGGGKSKRLAWLLFAAMLPRMLVMPATA